MAQQLPVKIAGLGWYLPERRVSSAELAQQLKVAPGLIERTTYPGKTWHQRQKKDPGFVDRGRSMRTFNEGKEVRQGISTDQ